MHPQPDPATLGEIVTRSQAIAAGMTVGQVNRRLRSGAWVSLRAGVYLLPHRGEQPADRFEAERRRHRQHAVAAVLRHPHGTIAGRSAALVHGMPLTSGVPSMVEIVVPHGHWTGRRAGVAVRSVVLEPSDHAWIPMGQALRGLPENQVDDAGADVARLHVPAMTPARTWVDIACRDEQAQALSAGDRALRTGQMGVAEVESILARMAGSRGCRRAAAVLPHLDGRRENALESLSFGRFLEWRRPLPVLQHEFSDAAGFIGRVDFYWPAFALVGEADGRLKYTSPEVLYAEKRRQERLEGLGLRVVRWGWSDVVTSNPRLWAQLRGCLLAAA